MDRNGRMGSRAQGAVARWGRWVGLGIGAAAFCVFAGADARAAADINVAYDAVDQIPCDGDCDVDGLGHCSLRAAVAEALCWLDAGGEASAGVYLPADNFTLTLGSLNVHGNFSFTSAGATISGGSTVPAIVGADRVGVAKITFRGFTTAIVAGGGADVHDVGFFQVGRGVSAYGTITASGVSMSGGQDALVTTSGDLSVGYSHFTNLTAIAISNLGSGYVSVANSTFENNFKGVGSQGDLTIVDCQFRWHTGQAAGASGNAHVTRTLFDQNYDALGAGGDVNVESSTFTGQESGAVGSGGDVVIADSTFSDGGDGAVYAPLGSVLAINSQFLRNGTSYSGGAISAGSSVSLTDCEVAENRAQKGGGLYLEPHTGTGQLYLLRTQVTANVAVNVYGGGGIDVQGPVAVEIIDSQITSNAAPAGAGGGMQLYGGDAALSFSNSLVTGNTASVGGGLYVVATGTAPPGLSLDHVVIAANQAEQYGGVLVAGPALTMVDSEISENVSGGNGGGLYLDSNPSGISGAAVIERSLFYLNHADAEGAAIYGKASGGLLLLGSTVSTNTGPTAMGAISLEDVSYGKTTPPVVIEASSIIGNGGVGVIVLPLNASSNFSVATVSLRSSLLADNAASCARAVGVHPWDPSYTYRRIADAGFVLDQGASCALTSPTSLSNVDPRVGLLANNGGPTRTHALEADSPAIDAGDPILVDLDQRGAPRVGAAPDIGAFEAPPTAPTLLSVSPSQGSSTGGTRITLRGRSLAGATVTVGGAACTSVTVVNATQVSCTTGAAALGTVDVSVTNGANLAATLANAYTYVAPPPPPPNVVSVAPTSGPTVGGSLVTVQGTDFASGSVVSIDGATLATTFISATELRATSPAHAAGVVGVAVLNPDGQTDSLPGAFTYISLPILTSLSPSHGPAAGNTTVTITGANFAYGASVAINGFGVACTRVNTTTMTFVTPPHPSGTVSVTVANPVDLFAPEPLTFTYDAAPTITSVSPNRGSTAGGTAARILGAMFTPTSQVRFGGVLASSTFVGAGELQVVTPPYPIPPSLAELAVDVSVSNPDGQTATASAAYTYVPPPNLTGLTPTSGLASGGYTVKLVATQIRTGATASFGGVSVPVSYEPNASYWFVAAPAHAAGVVDVVVTNPDGQTSTLTAGFTYLPLPTVTRVVGPRGATSGPTTAGTKVTITGTGFQTGAVPSFGGVAGTSIVVVTATSLTCVTPAHAAGVVDVTVRNPDGGAGTLTGGWTYVAKGKR